LGSISGDGRFVAYTSAPDVDPGDSVEFRDVFLLDRLRDTTTILTVTPLGDPSNGGSSAPQISDDGSTVVFNSSATNLVVNDADPEVDVYRWDAATGDLSLVSTRPDGPSANGTSIEPYVSSDGSVVVFSSSGTDLVEDDTNDTYDVFVWNDGSISRWSMTSEGTENDTWSRANGISGDGSTVFFRSHSATLVPGGDSFLSSYAATAPGEVELVDVATNGEPLSADGSAVWDSSDDGSLVLVVAGGENPGGNGSVLYLRDRNSGVTSPLMDKTPGELSGSRHERAYLTPDGRYVIFAVTIPDDDPFPNAPATKRVLLGITQEPTLDSFTPSTIGTGSTLVALSGSGFHAGATLHEAGGRVSFSDVTVVDANTILAVATVESGVSDGPMIVGVQVPHDPDIASGQAAAGVCLCLNVG